MISLLKIEEALERDTEGLDQAAPNRQRLLDLATVLSLTAYALERAIDRYSDLAGSEDDAAEARGLLQQVKSSILWLQAYRDVATEEEVCARVIAARQDSLRALFVARRVQRHHDKVWSHLQRFIEALSEREAG